MQIGRRNTTIAFVLLGALGVGLAIALNITWAFHWRSVAAVVLGIVLFGILIAALTLNTIFLVREIRRSEQHDSFINAVTHELKTPIASIKLYLETLQSRPVEDGQRQEFYRVMLEDVGRLLGTVEQVLKAGQVVQSRPVRRIRVDVRDVLTECVDLARKRHYLPDGQMSLQDYAGSEPARVLGDAEELRIAFSNVLDNAVKYSTRYRRYPRRTPRRRRRSAGARHRPWRRHSHCGVEAYFPALLSRAAALGHEHQRHGPWTVSGEEHRAEAWRRCFRL